MLRLDAGDAVVDDVGRLLETGAAELAQLVERHDPLAVTLAVEDDDLDDVGDLLASATQLLDLIGVLGEHDARARVGEDVDDVGELARRVHGRRRRASEHVAQVREDPLQAGRGGDGDAVLGVHAERDEARRDLTGVRVGLRPRHRLPGATLREAVRLVLARLRDAVDEQMRDAAGSVVDEIALELLVGDVHDHG